MLLCNYYSILIKFKFFMDTNKKLTWVIVLLAISIAFQVFMTIANLKISYSNSSASEGPGNKIGDMSAPVIKSVTPLSGAVGDLIRIRGTLQSKNEVYFCYQGEDDCYGIHSGFISGVSAVQGLINLKIPASLSSSVIDQSDPSGKRSGGGTIVPGTYTLYVKNTLGISNKIAFVVRRPAPQGIIKFAVPATLTYGEVRSLEDGLYNVQFESVTKDNRPALGAQCPAPTPEDPDFTCEVVVRLAIEKPVDSKCAQQQGDCPIPVTQYVLLRLPNRAEKVTLGNYTFQLVSVSPTSSPQPGDERNYSAKIIVAKKIVK